MRNWTITLGLILASALIVLGRNEETLDELKSRLERANPSEQVDLSLQIARRQLDSADKLYNDGKVEDARAAVGEVVTYSQKAGDTAIKSRKKLKKAEIIVREIAKKLRDIKRSLNFEDQAPVQDAVDRLEKVRTDLLAGMFGKGNQ